jgi:signal transduction histidine kinase
MREDTPQSLLAVFDFNQGRTRGAIFLLISAAAFLLVGLRDVTSANPLFHPHGYCYLWEPALVWTHVGADMLIGLSYMAIPLTLLSIVRRTRGNVPFSGMLVAFGTFIVACGFTHFVEVLTLWQPLFWTAAGVKVVTAIASVATAVAVPSLVPRVVAMMDAAHVAEERRLALEQAHSELERRVQERTRELTEMIGQLRDEIAGRTRAEQQLGLRDAELQSILDQHREHTLARERERRRQAEQNLREKDEFLAVLSHELRTPLNAVLGYLHMLRNNKVPAERLDNVIMTIERNARSLWRLVEDLLTVSGIVTKRLELRLATIDIGQVLRSAVDAVQPNASAKKITIAAAIPDSPIMAAGDEGRLQQVFTNLLDNAVKFSTEQGEVRLEAACDEGRVRIVVSDRGGGIEPDFLPHVFEAFRQGDSGPSRVPGGLGLGLAIVRRLIERHGGDVRAESPGRGQGAVFTVWLPLLVGEPN